MRSPPGVRSSPTEMSCAVTTSSFDSIDHAVSGRIFADTRKRAARAYTVSRAIKQNLLTISTLQYSLSTKQQ